jgi:hypothetical protein
MKNLIILAIAFFIFFFMYRTCTKGYDTYGYFVQVKDESVFATALSDADPRIVEHGRRLKTDIISKDIEVDNGDGPHIGALRWYGCRGIDCDEGWQGSFMPRSVR